MSDTPDGMVRIPPEFFEPFTRKVSVLDRKIGPAERIRLFADGTLTYEDWARGILTVSNSETLTRYEGLMLSRSDLEGEFSDD